MSASYADVARIVDEQIVSRRSVRAFQSRPVKQDDIKDILDVAKWVPSGSNTQPWKIYVLTGVARDELSAALLDVYNDPVRSGTETEEYAYYPRTWMSPYLDRRRKVGWDLYGLLGLTRENKAGMHTQLGRNFSFFDAPAALIFTMDRVMELRSWIDFGMFLQNVMIDAKARGLDACPQTAFTPFHRVVASCLDLPANEQFICSPLCHTRCPVI